MYTPLLFHTYFCGPSLSLSLLYSQNQIQSLLPSLSSVPLKNTHKTHRKTFPFYYIFELAGDNADAGAPTTATPPRSHARAVSTLPGSRREGGVLSGSFGFVSVSFRSKNRRCVFVYVAFSIKLVCVLAYLMLLFWVGCCCCFVCCNG